MTFAPVLALKADPTVVTFEIVTVSPPVTVSVTNSELDEPTVTFPKLIPLELGEIWETAVVAALLELVPARVMPHPAAARHAAADNPTTRRRFVHAIAFLGPAGQ